MMVLISKKGKELTKFCESLPLNRFITVNYALESKFGKEDFEGLKKDVKPFSCREIIEDWESKREALTLTLIKKKKIKDSFLSLMEPKKLEKMCINAIRMTPDKHERYLRALYLSASGDWNRWITRDDWLKVAQEDKALFIEDRPTKTIPPTMTNGVFHVQGLLEIDTKKRPRHFRLTYLGKTYVEEKVPTVVDEVRRERVRAKRKTYRRYERREESPEHKEGKKYLIGNAEKFFGKGTGLFGEEYLFSTNDRADLVFSQPTGDYIAVEVEVEVGEDELAGLLQAIKYKYMFAVEGGLSFDQVKGVLAAKSIHPRIKDLCKKYGIRSIELELP